MIVMMTMISRKFLILLGFLPYIACANTQAVYDNFTDIQAYVAIEKLNEMNEISELNEMLETIDETKDFENLPQMPEVYSRTEMNRIIRNNTLQDIVELRDRCQFAPDIENHARLVNDPVFEYAMGYMLMNGICFRRDENLGMRYIDKSCKELYPEALIYKAKRSVPEEKFKYLYVSVLLDSEKGLFDFCDQLLLGTKEFFRPYLYLEIQERLLKNEDNIELRKLYLKKIHTLIPENLRRNFKE